jgi:hypothetical protein
LDFALEFFDSQLLYIHLRYSISSGLFFSVDRDFCLGYFDFCGDLLYGLTWFGGDATFCLAGGGVMKDEDEG